MTAKNNERGQVIALFPHTEEFHHTESPGSHPLDDGTMSATHWLAPTPKDKELFGQATPEIVPEATTPEDSVSFQKTVDAIAALLVDKSAAAQQVAAARAASGSPSLTDSDDYERGVVPIRPRT